MEPENNAQVKDRGFSTYFLMCALGTISTLTGTMYLTPATYWMFKFRDTTSDYFGLDSKQFDQLTKTIYPHIANSLALAFLRSAVELRNRSSIYFRFIFSFTLIICMFLLAIIFVYVDTDNWQTGFLALTMIIGLVSQVGAAICTTAFLETVSRFPPNYLPTIVIGATTSELLISLTEMLYRESIDVGDYKTYGMFYFVVAIAFILVTALSFIYHYKKSNFFIYHLIQKDVREDPNIRQSIRNLLGKKYVAVVALTVLITFIVQPNITVHVLSKNFWDLSKNLWAYKYFSVFVPLFLYSIVDLISRECSKLLKLPSNFIWLLILSILRIAFIPLIMYCNVYPRNYLKLVFEEDYIFVIFIILMAASNGYVMNSAILSITKLINEKDMLAVSYAITFTTIVSKFVARLISNAVLDSI